MSTPNAGSAGRKRPGGADRPGARERIRAQRAEEARRQRRRRALIVVVAVLVVIAAAVGIGIAVQTSRTSSRGPLAVPAHATGPDGTTIVYGNPRAKATLQVYEDFRCPICAALERSAGSTIQHLADQGTYKIEYHFGAFLDGNLGGTGSRNALNAAGAALDESVARFKEFHDVLYANQPADERTDAFGSDAELLRLAGKVPGLRTPAFDRAVRNDTYAPWARKVADAFYRSGVTGTPTVKLDGKQLPVITKSGRPVTPAQFTALVHAALAGKG